MQSVYINLEEHIVSYVRSARNGNTKIYAQIYVPINM